jgi:hypothetical protein
MQSQKLVSGVNVSAAEFRAAKTRTVCEPCELGKQTRGTHPTSDSVSPAPLDMLHIDVLEMPVLSRQHFKYLLGVVDDHSRLACVAGLKTKGAAADNHRALILRLEKQRERQVKVVRSDMGREFLGGDLQGWLRERGIEHQTTAGYSSQSNGRAERFLRTLQDGIRVMLSESGLGQQYWCFAAYHCTRIYNRLPYSVLECTPWEACFGVVPDVSDVRVFGCHAFVHLPNAKQTNKLSERAVPARYLGKALSTGGDNFALDNGEIGVYRHASFVENAPVNQIPCAKSSMAADSEGVQTPCAKSSTAEDSEGVQEPKGAKSKHAVELRRSARLQAQPNDHKAAIATQKLDAQRVEGANMHAKNPKSVLGDAPSSFAEACSQPDADQWLDAMKEELASLHSCGTWRLAEVPPGTPTLPVRWIFKVKRDPNGQVERYKARLVVKGFAQRPGLDFDELYAPVHKHATLRAMLAQTASKDLELRQLDVKTAYLYGDIDRELYIQQPPGFEDGTHQACLLLKNLYGLKQGPRMWHKKLVETLERIGLVESDADPGLFIKRSSSGRILLLVYVDDMLLAGRREDIDVLVTALSREFDVRDLGDAAAYFLGYEIVRNRAERTLFVC